MRTHLRIGRVAGIPIGLNISVLLMCVALWALLAWAWLPQGVPDQPAGGYRFAGMVAVLIFLLSLVVHELGHALVAVRNNVGVSEITLWMFGGVAKLESEAEDPGAEFRIAAAGPFGSLLCAVVLAVFGWWLMPSNPLFVSVLRGMAGINLLLAAFNLLPGLPLDGGRILRATLWRRSRAKVQATRRAARIGRFLAVGFMILGVLEVVVMRRPLGLWTIGVGAFLFWAAWSEQQSVAPQPELRGLRADQLMRPLPRPLASWDTLADFERTLNGRAEPLYPVHDGYQRLVGWLGPEALYRVPPRQRHLVPVGSFVLPLGSLPTVSPEETVDEMVRRLGAGPRSIALVSVEGRPVGVVRSDDLDDVLELVE